MKDTGQILLEKIAIGEFAAEHPYTSTVWGPLGIGMALPGAGGILGTSAQLEGLRRLQVGLEAKRRKMGIRRKTKEFSLKHPYATSLGSEGIGALTGLTGGALLGAGLGAGREPIDVPILGKIPASAAYALGGGLIGTGIGGLSGRLLGTRSMLKAHEREVQRGRRKHASLESDVESLAFQEKLSGFFLKMLRQKPHRPSPKLDYVPPPDRIDQTGDLESPPDTMSGAAGEPPPFA